MRLAVTAAGNLAGDEADQHLQLFSDGPLVQDGLVELHERAHDIGTPRHRLNAVGREAACVLVMREAFLNVFGDGLVG